MLIKAILHTAQRWCPRHSSSECHRQRTALAGADCQQEHTHTPSCSWLIQAALGGPTFCGSKDTVLVYEEGTSETTRKDWRRL